MKKITTDITTRNQYDALKHTHLNYSLAKELLKSPAHYKAALAAPAIESKALRVGTYTHLAVLQPDVWQKYKQVPISDRRTKEGKELYSAFLGSLQPGEIAVDHDECELAMNVADAMNIIIERIGVKFTHTELMLTAEYCGVPLRCSIDGIGDDGYLYDIKSCEDAGPGPGGFLRNIVQYRYNLQAHMYRTIFEAATGIRPLGFRLIAVEKESPFAGSCYEIGPELQTRAAFDFEAAVKLFKTCTTLNEWPGYSTEIKTLDVAPKASAVTPINFA
jgi:exodeoxyribonuclease VIII